MLTCDHRVPKELISRFVKLCPTCQIRRGTNRNSPQESERSSEAGMEAQPPDITSGINLRNNSTTSMQSILNVKLPLQTAGFNSGQSFHQQHRWMASLQPQHREATRLNSVPPNTILSGHDTYSIIPPIPVNCTDVPPPGLALSSVNTFGNGTALPSAYSSDSTPRQTHGHVPMGDKH